MIRFLKRLFSVKTWARHPSPKMDGVPAEFSEHLSASNVGREIAQLHHEIQKIRMDFSQLTVEVRQLKMAKNFSPMYTEAMLFAQQGESVQVIADRCGISIGEAELVVSLARSEARGSMG